MARLITQLRLLHTPVHRALVKQFARRNKKLPFVTSKEFNARMDKLEAANARMIILETLNARMATLEAANARMDILETLKARMATLEADNKKHFTNLHEAINNNSATQAETLRTHSREEPPYTPYIVFFLLGLMGLVLFSLASYGIVHIIFTAFTEIRRFLGIDP